MLSSYALVASNAAAVRLVVVYLTVSLIGLMS